MDHALSVKYRIDGNPKLNQFHSHEDFEIFMFHEGVCRYFVNNQIYDLEPGDILLISGLVLHRPNILEGTSYIRSHVHFHPDSILRTLEAVKAEKLLDMFQNQHCLIRSDNSAVLHSVDSVFNRMSEVSLSHTYKQAEKEWELHFLLAQLLVQISHLSRTDEAIQHVHSSIKMEHAEKIAVYIQENFSSYFTIADIADHLCFHKSYVSHVFKEMTGYTIMEYVMHTRLRHARYLLEAKAKMPIEEVAYESGFENASHFSRYFKGKLGISPKEYRKKRLEIFQIGHPSTRPKV